MARNEGRERGGRRREGEQREETELVEKLVSINRVAKVVKAVGASALRRWLSSAMARARRLRHGQSARGSGGDPQGDRGRQTRHGSRAVARRPDDPSRRAGPLRCRQSGGPRGEARPGIIAGGPMRAIFESLGLQDVVAKSIGSSNPHT